MNTPEQFQEMFLDVNFDQTLIATNNPLINSSDYYLLYKQNYIRMTQSTLDQYHNVYQQYNQLITTQYQQLTPTKVVFTIIDTNRLEKLRQELKDLLILQQELLHNFLSYIEYLNKNVDKYITNDATKYTAANSDSKSDTASIRSSRRKRGVSFFDKLKFT